jgi:hypothetical protein
MTGARVVRVGLEGNYLSLGGAKDGLYGIARVVNSSWTTPQMQPVQKQIMIYGMSRLAAAERRTPGQNTLPIWKKNLPRP